MFLLDLNKVKQAQINKIKQDCTSEENVLIDIELLDGTQKEVTFKGGDSSASAINGGVLSEQQSGKASVKIWDINKKNWEVSINEGIEIASIIANVYMLKQYHRNDLITRINEASTIDEIENVVWTEPSE